MHIYDYAWLGAYYNERTIPSLAMICPEKWSFGSRNDYSILKSYLIHTFDKVYAEGKILENAGCYSIFNTGLFTQHYEGIYAYFCPNVIGHRSPWKLTGFYTEYQLSSMGVCTYPKRANYFENPERLIFDINCQIYPQYAHIFHNEENRNRIPITLRDDPNVQILFDGAVKRVQSMIQANYKTAVPQYHKGNIQLLIPIFLTSPGIPDLALVLSKNNDGTAYMGHTCLTIEMAYNNARLIARPDSVWLHP